MMFIKIKILYRVSLVIFLGSIFACASEEHKPKTPEFLKEIENIRVFKTETTYNFEISFGRERSFGDTPEINFGGLGGFDVDHFGRVYINDFQQNTLNIFESDGTFITTIGGSGNGPGEYTVGPYPVVKSDQLFLLDIMKATVNQYTIDDFELTQTITLSPTNKGRFEELDDAQLNQILIINDEKFLVRMTMFTRSPADKAGEFKDDRLIFLYMMGDDARLIKPIIKAAPMYEITGKVPDNFPSRGQIRRVEPWPQLFTKPLVAVSDKGNIFTGMSDQLLIKKYSFDGDYQGAIYHPFEHLKMNREDAVNSQITPLLADIVNQNEIPDIWPAMENMLVDDEERLWIATIVDDLSVYEWWVLEASGELISKFIWPRDEPIVTVKNDKMYTRETDEENGLQQIIRYGIELEKI